MRGRPAAEVPSGAEHFLTNEEAQLHKAAGAGHEDAVSVSDRIDKASTYGTHTIEYEVPLSVYEQLPVGEGILAEKVFKYSIPESYRKGVTPNKK
jgi:hypothetical protein